MTCIAWDGTTLAADRRATAGGQVYSTRKLFRIGECLVGFSGAADRIGAFGEWIESGADPENYPPNPDGDSVYALLVRPDRTVWRYERTAHPVAVLDLHATLGSGRDYARAAMHLGKSASEAVEIACLFDECCGNGIDTLTFGDPPTAAV